MKKIYKKPMAELVTFQSEENITASIHNLATYGVYPSDLVSE